MKNPLSFLNHAARAAVKLAIFIALLIAVTFAPWSPVSFPEPKAATPNIAVGAGQVMVFPFHFSGAISATAVATARFQMPQPCNLIGVGANTRALVGTTNTLDVKLGGTTVLSAPITFAAATTWYEGTIVTSAIPDEGVVTVDITIAGTSLTDVTLILTCARK